MVKINGEDPQPAQSQLDLKQAMTVFADMMQAQQEQATYQYQEQLALLQQINQGHKEQLALLNEIRGQQMKFEQAAIIAQEQNQEFMNNIADYLDFSASMMHSIKTTLDSDDGEPTGPTRVYGKRPMPFASSPSSANETGQPSMTPQQPIRRKVDPSTPPVYLYCRGQQEPSFVMRPVPSQASHQDSTSKASTPPAKIRCFHCGKFGHIARNCPYKNRPSS